MTVLTQATDESLVVAEVFGPVWQGEGPSTGVRCSFVRLGGCNLTCGWRRTQAGLERVEGAWACDEAKTWHSGYNLRETLTRMNARDVASRALAPGVPLVVISGGEPLLHQDHPGWAILLGQLLDAGVWIEVETNGTLVPGLISNRVGYRVSPKLAGSGLPEAARLVPDALAWHTAYPRSSFKFVAQNAADVAEAAALARQWGIPRDRTWIMPEGITAGRVLDVARAIAPVVALAGLNLTLRQHVLIYDEQGEPRDD